MSSKAGRRVKRGRRLGGARARVYADVPTASLFDRLPPPPPPRAGDERSKSGSHYTPISLVEQIVAKAIEPHLMWMAQDPEGWDKAHDRQPPPPPMAPHQFAHQYPLPCGCRSHRFKRDCPEHGQEAEAIQARTERERRRQEAADIPPALAPMLEVAVPMWIEQFRKLTWEERMKIRDQCLVGLGITDDGDALNGIANFVCGIPGKKPSGVAGAFNALAKGLALGALQPGGVTFAGVHFEAADAP